MLITKIVLYVRQRQHCNKKLNCFEMCRAGNLRVSQFYTPSMMYVGSIIWLFCVASFKLVSKDE